jgi:hypothetical protein
MGNELTDNTHRPLGTLLLFLRQQSFNDFFGQPKEFFLKRKPILLIDESGTLEHHPLDAHYDSICYG